MKLSLHSSSPLTRRCRLPQLHLSMQIDPDGHGVQTPVPPQTLWLNLTLRTADGKEGPLFDQPLDLTTPAPTLMQGHLSIIQCYQTLQIEFRSFSQQLSSQRADQYGSIIREHFLKLSVNMQILVGEGGRDHWGGKETWPRGYAEEPQRTRWAELEPGGSCLWACRAST